MIDHVLMFGTKADRPTGDGAPCWLDEGGRTWMPVDVIVVEAAQGEAEDDLSPAIHAPGAWMVIRTLERDEEIEEHPGCFLVSDSERAARGEPFVLLSRFQPETLLGRITPVFAGDAYPFPTGPASNLQAFMADAPP
ncbi:hypothetical protein [Aureimonas sp. ME7]|uniref:hypothetical protein n=1 Tax=Aureimonas sp. ME7 TaxID=2744252 RepID=UPI0015F49335|nr:hypothetical protein [Aureimonas sp. ME7]